MSYDWSELSQFAASLGSTPKYYRHHQPPDNTRRRMAHELDLLRALRLETDYEDTLRVRPEAMAAQAIGLAKSIVSKLDGLRSS